MKCLIISSATSKSAITPSEGGGWRDVAGGAAEHELGLIADGKHLLLALNFSDGDDRRFVQDDASPLT